MNSLSLLFGARSSRTAKCIFMVFTLAFVGCGPSAEERQAEALLAKAQELSLVEGKYQARWAAHVQADKLYKEIQSSYPKTNAAKAATKGLERLRVILEADRKLADEEMIEAYQKAMGQISDAAKPTR